MRVELVTQRSEIPLDAQGWNALVAANETNTIFQTYEWFDSWWRSFGARRRLHLLVVREADAVVGFAAFVTRRTRFGLRQLEFVGTGSADYQDFVLPVDKPRALRAICAFLVSERRAWQRLELTNIPGSSTTLDLFTKFAQECGLFLVCEARVSCPTLLLRDDRERARRILGKYSMRRPLNWFSKRGEVKFRHVRSLDEIRGHLPAFFDQHRRRWQRAGGASLFDGAAQRNFYAALAESLHSTGWLQFSIVEFNGAPLAFHFGFDYAGCVTWYKPTFEVKYAEHSPGIVLLHALIDDAMRRERNELDFTIGEESFKERFATRQRHNVDLGVYHRRFIHLAATGLYDVRAAAGRLVRSLRRSLRGRTGAQT